MEKEPEADLLIIGGGINGAGIARDAAGRGLKVWLCEQGDLAGATSSASSKLIHGGLRYLEYYQFRFVREALAEREILLGIAPHIIRPASFILPLSSGSRSAFVIGAGLLLYDWLARSKRLPRSRRLNLRKVPEGRPLQSEFTTGFAYSDCRVDDSRLVVLNALDAQERGAVIHTRTKAIEARRENLHWRVTLLDLRKKVMKMVIARALVNGAGPWAGTVLSNIHGRDESRKLRLVKGSHIIVPSFYEGAHCYVLQNDDRRIIFVMPYETDFCLIGTTEVPFEGDPATAETSTGETAYLCDVVSRYFRKPLYPRDVIKSFAGVRPLAEDGAASASAASRDYALMLDAPKGQAPLLSVLGGKITTYRRLAEDALTHLAPTLGPFGESWTATTALPGSDIAAGDYESFLKLFKAQHPWLSPTLAGRLAGAYGTRAAIILKGAKSEKDLGHAFGADLFQAEVDYLIEQELAQTAEDILWRRTKLALRLSQQEVEALSVYVERRTA